MAGRKFHPWFLILASLSGTLLSQLPAGEKLSGQSEEYLYREVQEALPPESMETAADRMADPLDLNRAPAAELESSGVFTAYQAHQIIRYREKYGSILSIHELAVLPGFNRESLLQLSGLISTTLSTGTYTPEKKEVWVLAQGGAEMLSGDSAHAGTPLESCLRLRAGLGLRLSMAATLQKDAGEPFISGGRPEYLAGYLQFRGTGLIRQLLAGTYKLHHGSGLVNGTGFMHSPAGYLKRPPVQAGLTPYRSTTESSYDQGVACRLSKGISDLTCWTSFRKLDLSTSTLSFSEGPADWMKHTRESGLHRTGTEIAGRGLIFRFQTGLRFTVRKGRTVAGIHGARERTGLTGRGMDSLNSVLPRAGSRHTLHHLGLFGQWCGHRVTLFGELASSGWKSTACIGGMGIRFSDFLQGQLLVHRYGRSYRGAYPSAYASGSKISAEQGFALHLHAETGRRLNAEFTLELYSFPSPRSGMRLPSHGYRTRMSFSSPGSSNAGWHLKWNRKTTQTTTDSGIPGTDPTVETCTDRFELGWRIVLPEKAEWRYRLIGTFMGKDVWREPGWAASQEAGFQAGEHLRIRVQWVAFRTGEWEKRIYLYQPGLYYSFRFPVCSGTGQRFTLVTSWKPAPSLTLSAAFTHSLRLDPLKKDVRLDVQVRWRL